MPCHAQILLTAVAWGLFAQKSAAVGFEFIEFSTLNIFARRQLMQNSNG